MLLMKWRDTVSGRIFWEPPGGGIKRGESPRAAAVRELAEETGLVVALSDRALRIEREYEWLGRHYRHAEAFFTARTTTTDVALSHPTEREIATFVTMAFLPEGEIPSLPEPLEPPGLPGILRRLR